MLQYSENILIHCPLCHLQVITGPQIRPGMTVIRTPLQQSTLGKAIIRTPVMVQPGIHPSSIDFTSEQSVQEIYNILHLAPYMLDNTNLNQYFKAYHISNSLWDVSTDIFRFFANERNIASSILTKYVKEASNKQNRSVQIFEVKIMS